VPTGLFVFFSYEVINKSVNQWFSAPAEELLHNSEKLAQAYYTSVVESTRRYLADFMRGFQPGRTTWEDLAQFRREHQLDAVMLLNSRGQTSRQSGDVSGRGKRFLLEDRSLILRNIHPGEVSYFVEHHPDEDCVICFTPSPWSGGEILVFGKRIPDSIAYRSFLINEAYEEYFHLKNQVDLIRLNSYIVVGFAGLALLVIFVWFGSYISKKITVPIEALVEGSQRVGQGNLSQPIECEANDEFEVLIQSFNRMMTELRHNQELVQEASRDLQRSNEALAARNTFIQTVLDSLATGVVSVNQDRIITSSNASARHLLKQRRIHDGSSQLQELIPPEKLPEIVKLFKEAEFHQRVSREIVFSTGRRTMHFAVTVSVMRGTEGELLGHVIVFDDVSDLIRTEKAAAWQEVAKRLAHEIKNPLTPIQLLVERIRKQFGRLAGEGSLPATPPVLRFQEILNEALQTVQTESRNLKYLVEEFSRFARLPSPNLVETDLNALVDEGAARQRELASGVRVETRLDPGLPLIYGDAELLRNVINNLLRNAVESIAEVTGGGSVWLETRFEATGRRVYLSVTDNGKGLADDKWENLFLPYFSTKKEGMGLGLTIVKKILDEHEASIKAEPVQPHGCRFVIEFANIRMVDNDAAALPE